MKLLDFPANIFEFVAGRSKSKIKLFISVSLLLSQLFFSITLLKICQIHGQFCEFLGKVFLTDCAFSKGFLHPRAESVSWSFIIEPILYLRKLTILSFWLARIRTLIRF